MNIFKRWRRARMRSRIANAVARGFGMAYIPLFLDDRVPSSNLHRAEIRAYWRGFASGEREFRKPVNVQQTLDEMDDIINRYRADPSKKKDLGNELRKITLRIHGGDIDERHDELYAALEAAAGELLIRGEPDTEFTLAEIEAEKRRSTTRRAWRERVVA